LQVLTNLIPVIHEFRHTTSLGFPQRFHNVVGSMDDDLKNSRRRASVSVAVVASSLGFSA
jgi:hypothetical protein